MVSKSSLLKADSIVSDTPRLLTWIMNDLGVVRRAQYEPRFCGKKV
jgi:hypothetical protein